VRQARHVRPRTRWFFPTELNKHHDGRTDPARVRISGRETDDRFASQAPLDITRRTTVLPFKSCVTHFLKAAIAAGCACCVPLVRISRCLRRRVRGIGAPRLAALRALHGGLTSSTSTEREIKVDVTLQVNVDALIRHSLCQRGVRSRCDAHRSRMRWLSRAPWTAGGRDHHRDPTHIRAREA